jgi:hypothetical protein
VYNTEVEEAVDHNYVYDLWITIDCANPVHSQAIGFARSTDGGHTFGAAVAVPGSFSSNPNSFSWDPAIAVAPNGVVYAAFMFYNADTGVTSPVVATSFDHGQTFAQVSSLPVPLSTDPQGNWGDRDFIAVARDGTVYVTWDYGPSFSEVQFLCSPTAAAPLQLVISTPSSRSPSTVARPGHRSVRSVRASLSAAPSALLSLYNQMERSTCCIGATRLIRALWP